MHSFTISIILILILGVLFVLWLWYREPVQLLNWWNQQIKVECDRQDHISLNGIPSYQNAWECSNQTAMEFHRLIQLYHDQILAEVSAIKSDPSENTISSPLLKSEDKWHPIWVKFMGDYTGSSDRLSILKQISKLFPEVITLYVSIITPGTTVIESRGLNRMVYRYNYGLKTAPGDVGLNIRGFDVKWVEREGFIWDNTLSHSAWNHTSEPRIVIMADIMRELSPINSLGSHLLYGWLRRTKPIRQIQQQFREETMIIT